MTGERDADRWWGSLTGPRRASIHRWLTERHRKREPDPQQLTIDDAIESEDEK